jgi:hypothetical protein
MTFVLHGRAFHRTVRSKDAAVARLRTQQRFALGALVEELTGVGRHRFTFSEAASGAHELGFKRTSLIRSSFMHRGRIAGVRSGFG